MGRRGDVLCQWTEQAGRDIRQRFDHRHECDASAANGDVEGAEGRRRAARHARTRRAGLSPCLVASASEGEQRSGARVCWLPGRAWRQGAGLHHEGVSGALADRRTPDQYERLHELGGRLFHKRRFDRHCESRSRIVRDAWARIDVSRRDASVGSADARAAGAAVQRTPDAATSWRHHARAIHTAAEA